MSENQGDVVDITHEGDAAAPAAASTTAVVDLDGIVSLDGEETAEETTTLPKRAVVNDDGSITLPFYVPVTMQWSKSGAVTTETISSVTLRRMTGNDVTRIMSVGQKKIMFEITAAAVKAQYNSIRWAAIMEKMDGADAGDVIQIAKDFLESGPRTPSAR